MTNPRSGDQVERQLGLPAGAAIHRQRMFVIGEGPGLEVFEISGEQRPASGLADFGLNHISVYCDDIEGSLARLTAAGGQPLSEIHENSRWEDSEGNGSVYVKAPWGMLIELQTIPNGALLPCRLTGTRVDALAARVMNGPSLGVVAIWVRRYRKTSSSPRGSRLSGKASTGEDAHEP